MARRRGRLDIRGEAGWLSDRGETGKVVAFSLARVIPAFLQSYKYGGIRFYAVMNNWIDNERRQESHLGIARAFVLKIPNPHGSSQHSSPRMTPI
jgi:hypothetical protein